MVLLECSHEAFRSQDIFLNETKTEYDQLDLHRCEHQTEQHPALCFKHTRKNCEISAFFLFERKKKIFSLLLIQNSKPEND